MVISDKAKAWLAQREEEKAETRALRSDRQNALLEKAEKLLRNVIAIHEETHEMLEGFEETEANLKLGHDAMVMLFHMTR